ncbi:YfjI family protein [Massilia niabensis]|uniref:YfjI family protein n=1 Tax=Massilia niabensis TaxID=544910 RepID=A0ABW0L411_9BURK
MTSLNNVLAIPPVDGWPDDPLPLVAELARAEPFPMDALPPVLADYGHVIRHCMQAPDALIGNSLLAAASLAVQPYANVTLPHGASVPTSLFFVSIAESGERKSAVDRLALHPHALFEKVKSDQQREAIEQLKRLPKAEIEKGQIPRDAVFLASDPTIEGLCKLLHSGLPSMGVFSAEGGRFLGGHGMSDDAALRTAAGLSSFWDGAPVDRVRAGDGASKLYNRRLALHLMAQPRAALEWLGNPVLKDQGLFSRCLIAYPESTAGTRLFRAERADKSSAAAAYEGWMFELLNGCWPINEFHELQPQSMRIVDAALDLWVSQHDQIERAIVGKLLPVRALASKAAEHIARIAAVLTLVTCPDATEVSEDSMRRAAILVEFYLGEALRLSDVQPQHEQADLVLMLWNWLVLRGKRHVTLPELAQYGPAKLRKTQMLRSLMGVLADHYMVRRVSDGMIEYNGKTRREAWEVRL